MKTIFSIILILITHFNLYAESYRIEQQNPSKNDPYLEFLEEMNTVNVFYAQDEAHSKESSEKVTCLRMALDFANSFLFSDYGILPRHVHRDDYDHDQFHTNTEDYEIVHRHVNFEDFNYSLFYLKILSQSLKHGCSEYGLAGLSIEIEDFLRDKYSY